MVSVETYAYTPAGTALSGTPTSTKAFTYGDAQNPDRLTSYNGKAITYNANGGVASYDGYTYTWNKGKLSSISKVLDSSPRALILPSLLSSKTYSFDYNGLGQRVSSSYNYVNNGNGQVVFGELISYNKKFSYDHSGRLIHETNTKTYYGEGSESYDIVYLYDDAGVVGMAYIKNGVRSEYYFLKNLQGDVVEIYDTIGAKVAGYTYDAWGNCSIAASTTDYAIAQANPFRYRSYYYDSDTNLYYLNARYYSPELRRFISPDDTTYIVPKNANGLNLYCYCNNDPVNFVDPSGHFSFLLLGLSIGISLLFELVDDYFDGGLCDGSHDWKDYLGAGISGAFGALGGGLATQTAFALVGGLADATLSGDLQEDGFWNTMGSIALSSVVSFGIGHSTKRIASGIKAYSLKRMATKFGNNVANRQLRAMGTITKMGSNAVKNSRVALTKVIYNSKWIIKDISEMLIGSISGGIFSQGYGYVSDVYDWYF